jgi:hypothetical protein
MNDLKQDVHGGGQGRGLCIGRELEGDRENAGLAVGPGPHGRRGQLGRVACWHYEL